MALTYDSIATTTLGSAGTITFSSIPSTFTDLRLVIVGTSITNGDRFVVVLNSDTGSNYSYTNIYGTGTTITSFGINSTFTMQLNANNNNLSDTVPCFATIDFLSYANTNLYKSFLSTVNTDLNGSGSVCYTIGTWQNTSAITTINLTNAAGSYKVGTTATLYGIKAA